MNDFSRRRFLQGGVAVAAGAVPFLNVAPGFTATVPMVTTPQPSGGEARSLFSALIGQAFTMTGPKGSASVVLMMVNDLVPAKVKDDPNSFLMVFRAPRATTLPQDVYAFSNPRFGTASFLAVPVDRVVSWRNYEVVINRTNL